MSIRPLERPVSHISAPLPAKIQEERHSSLRLAAWSIAVIEVMLGYEWLLSALNKLFSPVYVAHFSGMLQQMALPGNPNGWWVAFIQSQVLPSARLWARLIEVGELGVALGFFAGALLWISGRFPDARWTRWLNVGIIVALVGSVLMSVNYYLMMGNTLPWLNPADPFDEGLSLDGLLTGIGTSLFILHVLTWWTYHRLQVGVRKRSTV